VTSRGKEKRIQANDKRLADAVSKILSKLRPLEAASRARGRSRRGKDANQWESQRLWVPCGNAMSQNCGAARRIARGEAPSEELSYQSLAPNLRYQ